MYSISKLRIFATLVPICVPLASAIAGVDVQIADLKADNASWLQYPTQFTQGIVPKPIHSHNDYWREVPLLTALSFGVASVEADVWLVNDKLYVGHERAALTEERTFDSLYIQPLVQIVKGQNPETPFNVNASSVNGVFDTASGIPLQLLVDMKTDGTQTFPFVVKALEPLRELGFLTTFVNGSMRLSAVTVVGTGNTPLEAVKALSPRDLFFDAPLTGLTTDPNTTYDATLSPVASTDYEVAVGWSGIGNITDAQLANLTRFVNDAHSRGIRARFWDTPGWPIQARNNVWSELLKAGADWLNADDLEAASVF
ncbi:hypothetical protein VNI00_001502 [Paramarasmius palmivorus]|uniref:Altered inheritance of mitochondria protein 6 n=1 Tax=Paramarasmius palmivorus TaxID=297713 RepID=A0AAW0E5G2_9AGAR